MVSEKLAKRYGDVVAVDGIDFAIAPGECFGLLGPICPQDVNLDQDFTVLKNLIVFARYFGVPQAEARRRAERLIERLPQSSTASVDRGE